MSTYCAISAVLAEPARTIQASGALADRVYVHRLEGKGPAVMDLTLMTVGDRLLAYAVEHFGLPRFWAFLWAKLRFPAAAVAGYFSLFFLYALAQDTRQPWRNSSQPISMPEGLPRRTSS